MCAGVCLAGLAMTYDGGWMGVAGYENHLYTAGSATSPAVDCSSASSSCTHDFGGSVGELCPDSNGLVTIPTAVTQIPNNAFLGCSQLANIAWHNGITDIGQLAFQETSCCSGSLTLPV